MSGSGASLKWAESELGDHDAPVTGFVVGWVLVPSGSEDAADAAPSESMAGCKCVCLWIVRRLTVEHSAGDGECPTDSGLAREFTVTGLAPDRNYSFYVRAVNSAGVGPKGLLSDPVRV